MITIKKISIKTRIELMDGTTFPPEYEENYVHDLTDSGYLFSLDRIENYKDESIFQKEVFIPYTNIKKAIEQFEYQIEKQEVFDLIESSGGITAVEIKNTLEREKVKLSENDLKSFLKTLEGDDEKIFFDSNLWVTKESYDRALKEELSDEIKENQPPPLDEGLSCGRSDK